MWAKQLQGMCHMRVLHGRRPRNRGAVAWPFSRLWRVSDIALFQMTFIAALWVAVFGKCGPPPDLHYALPVSETNQTDFEIQTVLKYNCRPGYTRSSSSQTISCKPEGEWHIDVKCVRKSCGNLGDLRNGQVDVKTDLYFGSQIEFSCSEGYILIGSSTSYCEAQSKGVAWSDPLPECVIVKCRAPPVISNGRHNGGYEDFYEYGASVTYRCNPSFSLLGNATITCTVENKTIGIWSSSPPTCEKISCSQPNIPYGKITFGFRTTYKYKDAITFDCLKGATHRGRNIIHCEADGKWSPTPICELNSCTNVPNIPHAFWSQNFKPKKEDLYPVGTTLYYHCHLGYAPATKERQLAVTCQKNFTWSSFKECKEVCCPVPDPKSVRIVRHTKIYPENSCTYFYDDTVSYTCHDHYISSATCKSDGTWTPETPACDQRLKLPERRMYRMTMINISLMINDSGYMSALGYHHRSGATYECDKGYRLVGQASIYCIFSQWRSEAPQCKALCQKPEIRNGMLSVNKDEYVESENVTIQCYSGFALLGSQSITCSENRTWHPEVPTCEPKKDCEHVFAGKNLMQCLPNPADVKMALEIYKLSLEIKLLELQIEKPKLTDAEYKHTTRNKGKKYLQMELWKTSHSTLFQMTLATVLMAPVLGDCGPPPSLPFASPINQLYETSFSAGTVLKYACHHGFKKVNSSHLICDENGSWIYSIFCAKKRCRNPGELVNGKVEITTDLFLGSTIEFSCAKGYLLIGSATSRCEAQGKGVDWSDSLPECSPPEVSNGKHSGRDEDLYIYGSSVTYSCDPGFTLLGNASIVCSVQNKTIGVWSPSPPACEKIICQQPQIQNGDLVPGFRQFYTYKDSVDIRCKIGYVLRGSTLIRCEANSKWYPSVPTCEPNGCTDVPDIPNVFWEGNKIPIRNFQKFEIGTKLKYQCKPGFRLIPNDTQTVTCQENLTWSSSKGCERICCPAPSMEKIRIVSERRDFTGLCTYAYGDYVFYVCGEGSYPISTDGRSSCQADGKWRPAIPSCQGDIPNLKNPLAVTSPNSSATIMGGNKYLTDNDVELEILCMKAGSQIIKVIIHGNLSVEKDQYAEMENITIQCDTGYDLVGSPNIICSENRTWYPEIPSCKMEVLENCRQVYEGRKLFQCLSSPEDVKRALEVYKLVLEIEKLEQEKDKWSPLDVWAKPSLIPFYTHCMQVFYGFKGYKEESDNMNRR
ncbi:C4b-binding protein alpha chain, partial [Sigmodon hispidus]